MMYGRVITLSLFLRVYKYLVCTAVYTTQIYSLDYSYSCLYKNDGDNTFSDIVDSAGAKMWDA